MKKTLIALLALGSVAMATDTIISNTTAGEPGLLVDGGVKVSELNLTSSMQVISGTGSAPSSTAYRNSFTYTPINIGNIAGAEVLFSLEFTITEVEEGAQGMTIDFFSLSGQGKPQNQENGYLASVYLGINGEDPTEVLFDEYKIITQAGDNTYVGSAYDGDGIAIAEKSSYCQLNLPNVEWTAGDYIMKVTFSQDSDYPSGVFGGIGNVTLHGANVPEPTTGTLSLLALAGLCIRRRK